MRTFDEYHGMARYVAVYPGRGTLNGLLYAALGLGEAGEVQGKIKKILRDNDGVVTEEAKQAIKSELGDVLWYIAMVSDELGLDLEDVANDNIKKLLDRKARGVLQGSGDNR